MLVGAKFGDAGDLTGLLDIPCIHVVSTADALSDGRAGPVAGRTLPEGELRVWRCLSP
jgi:hypothetical protein